jgi:hypothetical protein
MPELLLERPILEEQTVTSLLETESHGVSWAEQDHQIGAVPESLGLRDRFFRSRLGRVAMAGLASLGLTGGIAVAESSPAYADSNHTYTVTGTGGEGVWLHGDPGLGDKGDLITVIPEGATVEADCYVNDTPIGNGNPAWLHVTWSGRTGFMTDYYSSSRWNRNNTLHDQGLTFCGEKPGGSNEENEQPEGLQPAESVPIFASYDRDMAVNWALEHATDTPPNAGSCTWFVSNVLWRGGMQETAEWNNDPRGVKRDGIRYGTDYAWKTPEFLAYMRSLPYVDVDEIDFSGDNENRLPDAKLGDIIIYDWEGNKEVDHAVVITGFSKNNPAYPLVTGWSEDGSAANKYNQRGWTWSEKNQRFIQNVQDEHGNYPHKAIKAHLVHIRSEEDLSIR